MKPILNFFVVISTLGAVQSILIAMALFTIKTGNRSANRFLGLFLLSLSVLIFSFIMHYTRLFLIVPHFYGIDNLVVFLVGPLLFFYVKSLTILEFKFRWKDVWHFALFGIMFLLNLPEFFWSSEARIAEYLAETNRVAMTAKLYLVYAIIDLNLFAYLIASLWLCWKQDQARSLKNPPVNVSWLRNLLMAFLIIQIFSTIFDFFNLAQVNWSITPFFLTIVIYSMSYVGIRQSEIFTGINLMKLSLKYQKSPLTEEMAEKIIKKLELLMKGEKIYMDSTLSLPQLAHKLAISTHLLSQVLNERLNRNFFNFISEYRIQEAQRILRDPQGQKYSMLDIAQEVGFNSISAFNTAFKKYTGLSPSEFRKQPGG